MKKTYPPPTIEKIAFRYRDQVVAASGDGNDEQQGSQVSIFNTCGGIGDWIVNVPGDMSPCFS